MVSGIGATGSSACCGAEPSTAELEDGASSLALLDEALGSPSEAAQALKAKGDDCFRRRQWSDLCRARLLHGRFLRNAAPGTPRRTPRRGVGRRGPATLLLVFGPPLARGSPLPFAASTGMLSAQAKDTIIAMRSAKEHIMQLNRLAVVSVAPPRT